MGLKGDSSGTQTVKQDPWKYSQPFLLGGYINEKGLPALGKGPDGAEQIQGIFPIAMDMFNSGGFQIDPYSGSTVSPFSAQTQQALDATQQRALAGDSGVKAAKGLVGDTLAGKYLDPTTNPAWQSAVDNIKQQYGDTTASTAAMFNRGGAFGGSANQEYQQRNDKALGDSLFQAAGNLYNTERGYQQSAINQAPALASNDYADLRALSGVGNVYDTQSQNLLNADINKYYEGKNAPINALAGYQNFVGGNYGGQTTTSTPYHTNPAAGLLGGALGGAQLFGSDGALAGTALGSFLGPAGGSALGALIGLLSDRRLKENVELVGEENGFPIYHFNYIGLPQRFKGVMAQDVLQIKPEAVTKEDGVYRVNYPMLGIEMEPITSN